MSSAIFDVGDLQRLDRERTLTEQAPRALPAEDKTPDEDEIQLVEEEENDFDIMLDGLLLVLQRRINE